MTYYLTTTPDGELLVILMDGNVATSFTENPESSDWQRYQEWLAEGNTPVDGSPFQPDPAIVAEAEALEAAEAEKEANIAKVPVLEAAVDDLIVAVVGA